MATPAWLAATAGQPTQAGQLNQLLGTHASTFLYTATQQAAQSTTGSGAINSNSLYIAQSFATGGAQTLLGRVILTLAVTGAPAALPVALYANSAGAPTGAALSTTLVPREFLTGSPAALSIPLPATVTAATTYWVVAGPAGDVSDYFSWSKSNQVTGASTSSNGSTWAAQAYGLLYQEFDQSAVTPLLHTWEDSGVRWTHLGYNATGQINVLAEYTVAQASGYLQSSRTLSYASGLLSGVA